MNYYALMNADNRCINILATPHDTVNFIKGPGEWDTIISKEIFQANPIGLYFQLGEFVPPAIPASQENILAIGDTSGNNT